MAYDVIRYIVFISTRSKHTTTRCVPEKPASYFLPCCAEIFVQSSFLVYHLPESWSLTTWIVVALQVANFCAMLVLRPLVNRPNPPWVLLSASMLLLGFGTLTLRMEIRRVSNFVLVSWFQALEIGHDNYQADIFSPS